MKRGQSSPSARFPPPSPLSLPHSPPHCLHGKQTWTESNLMFIPSAFAVCRLIVWATKWKTVFRLRILSVRQQIAGRKYSLGILELLENSLIGFVFTHTHTREIPGFTADFSYLSFLTFISKREFFIVKQKAEFPNGARRSMLQIVVFVIKIYS